jgi:hypothetical protein
MSVLLDEHDGMCFVNERGEKVDELAPDVRASNNDNVLHHNKT